MKLTFSLLTLLSLLLGALLSACAGFAAAPNLDGTNWQLIEMNGKKLPIHIVVTLGFNAGQAGGNAPCNSYGAGYTQKGNKLTIEDAFTTLMYCEGVMDDETEFNAAFSTIKSFKLENDRLSLLDQSGKAILVFGEPQAAPVLEGSSWKVTTVGATTVAEGVEVTLSFANGQISGKAACNNYFAGYTQKDAVLNFSMVGSTKMFCGEEGIMELETDFLGSLEKVRSFEIQMGGLALLDEAGALLIYLAPSET